MKNLDFNADKALAKDFLTNFADAHGEPKYLKLLQDVSNRKLRSIQIELDDLFNYKDLDENFLQRVTENTRRYISIFAEAIDELMPEPTEVFPVDEDRDILMTQRVDDGADGADNSDPLQKMPSEIKRFLQKDKAAGKVPVAFVVRAKDAELTVEAVKEFIAKQVVFYKRLHKIYFVHSIPKSPSGKILRKDLRAGPAPGADAGSAGSTGKGPDDGGDVIDADFTDSK